MFFVAIACVLGAILWCNQKGNQDRQAKKTSLSIIVWGGLAVLGIVLVLLFPAWFFGS